MLFRKFLIKIKDKQNKDPKNLYFYCVVVFLAFSIGSVVVDAYLPFDGWWMALRTLLLIPLTLSSFVGLYALSLEISEKKDRDARSEGEVWIPLRLRYSPKWRRNVSLIIVAIVVVITYATNQFIGYTIFSSLIVTLLLALLAFCRLTRVENKRAELNVSDPRDSMFEERMKKYYNEREKAAKMRKSSDETNEIYEDDDERIVQSTKDKNK